MKFQIQLNEFYQICVLLQTNTSFFFFLNFYKTIFCHLFIQIKRNYYGPFQSFTGQHRSSHYCKVTDNFLYVSLLSLFSVRSDIPVFLSRKNLINFIPILYLILNVVEPYQKLAILDQKHQKKLKLQTQIKGQLSEPKAIEQSRLSCQIEPIQTLNNQMRNTNILCNSKKNIQQQDLNFVDHFVFYHLHSSLASKKFKYLNHIDVDIQSSKNQIIRLTLSMGVNRKSFRFNIKYFLEKSYSEIQNFSSSLFKKWHDGWKEKGQDYNNYHIEVQKNENHQTRPQSNTVKANGRILTTTPNENSIEYIRNPKFLNNTCGSNYCVWSVSNFMSHYVDGWNPDPQIQIGVAKYYTNLVSSGYLTELIASRPTCIWQLISNLPRGLFQAKYQYAVHRSIQLQRGRILVYLNQTLVHVTSPHNYQLNYDSISNITINENNSSIKLKLCSNQTTGITGTLIFQVSFKKVYDLPQSNLYQNQQNSSINNSQLAQQNSQNTTDTTETDNSTSSQSINNNTSSENSTIQTAHNQTTSNSTHNLDDLINSLNQTQNLQDLINQINTFDNPNSQKIFATPTPDAVYFILQLIFQSNSTQLLVGGPAQTAAIRTIFRPYFSFLVNLDHLWLYAYHQRQFSSHLKPILEIILNFQENKWNFVQDFIKNTFGKTIDFQPVQTQLSNKIATTPIIFYYIEQRSRQFLANNFKFFLVNIPLVLFIYLSCRGLHYIFSKISLRQIFKQFALKSYLILMLLEGNSEPFTYFLLSDILTMLAYQFDMKLINLASVLFLFLLMMLLISIPFILRSKYEKKQQIEYYDRSRNNLEGTVFFMIDFGFYNILLGCAHLLLQNKPDLQFLILSIIEATYIGYTISNFRKKRIIFPAKFTIWIGILASFLRILLIMISYLLQKSSGNLKARVDQAMIILIFSYGFMCFLSVVQVVFQLLYSASEFIIIKIRKLICKKKSSIKLQDNLLPIRIIGRNYKRKQLFIINNFNDTLSQTKNSVIEQCNHIKPQLTDKHKVKNQTPNQVKLGRLSQSEYMGKVKRAQESQVNVNDGNQSVRAKRKIKASRFGQIQKNKFQVIHVTNQS